MNNFPAMAEAQRLLAALCKIEIKRWQAASESNPNMRYMAELMEIALAALTAKPRGYIDAGTPSDEINILNENKILKTDIALYTAPPAPAPVLTAELFAYSYLYAAYETCDGFAGWSHKFSLEHPPEWMLETGKVKNLRKLYTVPPAPVMKPIELPCADHETDDGYEFYRKETVIEAIRAAGYEVKQ